MPSFAQRLFETDAKLSVEGGRIVLGDWSAPRESVMADGNYYMRDMKRYFRPSAGWCSPTLRC